MNILITGGTGLIGRALCKALTTHGHALTVLSRHPDTVQAKCGAMVSAITSLDEWQVSQFDSVINLAGAPILNAPWTAKRKQLVWDSRVNLTQDLVQRISQSSVRPKSLLNCSAIGFYGERGDTILDEAAAGTTTDFASRLCAAWEAAALPAENLGLRVCLMRTGLVLSSQGGLLGQMLLPFKLGLGTRIGSGRQWMSWIHIEDYVNLVLFLLNNENASGTYNMTAPTPVTNMEYTATLARILHRPAPFAVPESLLNILLGERAQMLTFSQGILPMHAEADGFTFRHRTLDAALADLLQRSNQ